MKNSAVISVIITSSFLFRCANPVTPTGGVKDIAAPKIVLTSPLDRSTNIKPKTILLKFDENIQTNNIKEQLVISPAPLKKPEIFAGKNTIRIELTDNALSDNITYSIQLNEAIKDLNEGNQGYYAPLLFSTGSSVDTLSINGSCIFIDEPKTVKLKIQTLSSAPKRTIPNKALQFTISGLSNDSIWITAYNDIDGNETWNKGESVGLIKAKATDSINIVLYSTAAKKAGLIKYSTNRYGCYGRDLPKNELDNLIAFKDTLIGDSNAVFTFLQSLDTTAFIVSKKAELKKDLFSYYWKKPSFLKDSFQELYFVANRALNKPKEIVPYINSKQQKNEATSILSEKNVIRLVFKNNQTGSIRIPNPFTSQNGDSIQDTFRTSIPFYTALNIHNKEPFDIYTCITNRNTSDSYYAYLRTGEKICLWALSGEHDIFYYQDKNRNQQLDGPDISSKIPGEYFRRLPVLKIKENLAVDLDIKSTDKP